MNIPSVEQYIPYDLLKLIKLDFNKNLIVKIVKPRKSKLGDFRYIKATGQHIITLNNDLNTYSLLITFLHELAHFKTFVKFGFGVKAHGSEWKNEFCSLLKPLVNSQLLPENLTCALKKSMINLKASSQSDRELYQVLKSFDKSSPSTFTLEKLEHFDLFIFENRIFRRIMLRRTRYLCVELSSQRNFLIHRLAEVKKYQ